MARRVKSLQHGSAKSRAIVYHRDHRAKKRRPNYLAQNFRRRKEELTIRELENEQF